MATVRLAPHVDRDELPFSPREWLEVVGGFTLLTLILTYPQIRYLTSGMGEHYDALFSTWRLAWIAHQLPRHPLQLFDANIFYPQPGTLSYSDAMLLPGLLGAPLIWIGIPAVAVHNGLVLVSFVACAAAMYLLVRTETQSRPAAWFAGMVFAFQPYRFAHYAQLELLWAWPVPLAFWSLTRVLTRRRVRDGLVLGAIVALQALSCLYYVVFLVTALAILTVVRLFGRPWTEWRATVKPFLAAALVCAAVIGPYSLPYLSSSRPAGTRTVEDILFWSPSLRSYVTTSAEHVLHWRPTWRYDPLEHVLFPGVVALAVAIVGVVGARRRLYIAYIVLFVLSVDLSLGFNGLTYRAFFGLMWPFHSLRVPARMFVIVSAAMAALGGRGVTRLLRMSEGPMWRRLLPLALVILVFLESASMPIPLAAVPTEAPPLYRWLGMQPPGVIMEWPLPRASSLADTQAPLFMYYSTFHWHALVNGYTGIYPESYVQLIETVADFPDDESIRYLQRIGVRFIVLHSSFAPARYGVVAARLRDYRQLRLMFTTRESDGEVVVYELAPNPS